MPRFVILRHDNTVAAHWDFMLQCGPVLRAWALQGEPTASDPGNVIEAAALPDHRPAYLDYEGPVSDGRGRVEHFDGGSFQIVEMSDERITVNLAGRKLVGRATLVLLPATSDKRSSRWQFSFAPD